MELYPILMVRTKRPWRATSYLHLQAVARMVPIMAELSRDDAKQRIRSAGLRATAPRVAVLRLLEATDKPISHSEVLTR